MVFNNLIQYNTYVNEKLSIALDNTMDRLLIELQNIIEKEVYGWISPSEFPWSMDSLGRGDVGVRTGQRTGQFLDSWESKKSVMIGNILQGEISQAIDIMQQFFNDDNIEVHKDRDNLANIISSGKGYNFGQCFEPRDFWSEFKSYVTLNLFNIFEQECLALGLPMQKVGVL